MAKCTAGPIISNIAGSIGGLTFRNDKSGLVLSLKQQPTRKQSDAQLEHRLFFSEGARAWSALDADIQLAWNTLAKSEVIPSFFSRGRTWSGRQLFQCFYTYARHQMTPLPGRWLPTPPLFYRTNYSGAAIFGRTIVDNYDPPPDWFYSEYSSLQARLPGSLDPFDPPGSISIGACSLFASYSAPSVSFGPRSFTRVAPVAPALAARLGFPDASGPGSGFDFWSPVLVAILGWPPGTTPSTSGFFEAQWKFWFQSYQVTNERLFFSGIISGTCIASNVSADRTEAYFGERLRPPTVFYLPGPTNENIPHV